MSEEQKRLLEKQLWGVANVLRGKMNADEYKNYILGFFLKPTELFSYLVKKGKGEIKDQSTFILEDLKTVLTWITLVVALNSR